jgi:hypothetical protein
MAFSFVLLLYGSDVIKEEREMRNSVLLSGRGKRRIMIMQSESYTL